MHAINLHFLKATQPFVTDLLAFVIAKLADMQKILSILFAFKAKEDEEGKLMFWA